MKVKIDIRSLRRSKASAYSWSFAPIKARSKANVNGSTKSKVNNSHPSITAGFFAFVILNSFAKLIQLHLKATEPCRRNAGSSLWAGIWNKQNPKNNLVFHEDANKCTARRPPGAIPNILLPQTSSVHFIPIVLRGISRVFGARKFLRQLLGHGHGAWLACDTCVRRRSSVSSFACVLGGSEGGKDQPASTTAQNGTLGYTWYDAYQRHQSMSQHFSTEKLLDSVVCRVMVKERATMVAKKEKNDAHWQASY